MVGALQNIILLKLLTSISRKRSDKRVGKAEKKKEIK
jgi:hypothetical protein